MKGIKPLLSILIYLALVFSVFALYSDYSSHWVAIGGGAHFGIHSQLFYFEIPFFLLCSLILYFPKIENKLVKFFVPIIPLLVLYLSFDLFYSFLARSPHPSDIQDFSTIFDFSLGMAFAILIFSSLIPLSIVVILSHARKKYKLKSFIISTSCRILLIVTIATLLSSNIYTRYISQSYDEIHWSQRITIKNNGRFSSFIYYGNQEKQNLAKFKKYTSSHIDVEKSIYPGSLKKHQNIHIVVLESFIDPRLLKGIQFNRDPLAAELKPFLLQESSFSHTLSPTYGGNTARAEFEILTGVKSLPEICSIEFNVMCGKTASSLVNKLKKYNYRPIATVASNSGYFNSLEAYRSLGFDEISFLEEDADFKIVKGDTNIFDGTLFDHNIKKIKSILKKSDQPIFNYVLGMYGHFPYERNLKVRPDVIEINSEEKIIKRIANQFYYRTKALAKYIDDLISIDPDSIIFVTSDHLPPVVIVNDKLRYKLNNLYLNIAIFIKSEIPVDVNRKKYYEIPWLIWDFLSATDHKRNITDKEMTDFYYKLLRESI